MPPACKAASAISGLPITMVATLSGSFMIRAWSTGTSKTSACAAPMPITANKMPAHKPDSARLRAPNAADIELSNATHATDAGRDNGSGAFTPLQLTANWWINCKRWGLLAERIQQLAAKALRKLLVVDAIGVGQLVRGHVPGAEQNIPDRERAGEVARAAAIGRGMVPAVENRPGDHVFERAERPVEIGMDKGR